METGMSVHSQGSCRCSSPPQGCLTPQDPVLPPLEVSQTPHGCRLNKVAQEVKWSQHPQIRVFVNSTSGVRNVSGFQDKPVLSQHCCWYAAGGEGDMSGWPASHPPMSPALQTNSNDAERLLPSRQHPGLHGNGKHLYRAANISFLLFVVLTVLFPPQEI